MNSPAAKTVKRSSASLKFSEHFERCYRESLNIEDPNSKPPIGSEHLFDILFGVDENDDSKEKAQKVIQSLIRHTYEAETILTQTFLYMTKGVLENLIKRKGRFAEITKILNHINDLSELIDEAYFKVSQEKAISAPDIDQSTQEYRSILETFNKYAEKDNDEEEDAELTVHSYYRSIPVQLNATVKHVASDSVAFNVHPYEAVSLSFMGMAFIESSVHKAVYKAYVKHVDIPKRTAEFTHFIQVNHPAEQRSHIRVEPKGIIKTQITTKKGTMSGYLCDFSEETLAFYIRNVDISQLKKGEEVAFSSDIPNIYDDGIIAVDTSAEIVKVRNRLNGDPNAHKIVIKCKNDQGLKTKLQQYISQRQVEIMKELKELSESNE